MKPASWTPLTGKWLRRGIGGLVIAAGLCVLAFAPYFVVVTGGTSRVAWTGANTVATALALGFFVLGGYLISRG